MCLAVYMLYHKHPALCVSSRVVVEGETQHPVYRRQSCGTKHGQGSIRFTQGLIIVPAASARAAQNVRVLPGNTLYSRSTHFSVLTTQQGLLLTCPGIGTRPPHVYQHTSALVDI